MHIARARVEDVPLLIEVAREFAAQIPDCPLDEEGYIFSLQNIVGSCGAIFLLFDGSRVVGMIGGVISPDIITGRMMALELFWYVLPAHRHGVWAIRLLNELEGWAKESKCQHIAMVHLECSMPETMKRIYLKRGYELFETVYRKRIGG